MDCYTRPLLFSQYPYRRAPVSVITHIANSLHRRWGGGEDYQRDREGMRGETEIRDERGERETMGPRDRSRSLGSEIKKKREARGRRGAGGPRVK